MDLQIPLNRLKFGHEDGEGINARVVGRGDGIAALAANIFANRSEQNPSGLIENLIVKEMDDGFFAVANGNRRLAALHMIELPDSDSPIPCTLHQVDETRAFEYSLTTAITAEQLHPVDQHEAFARLAEHGKTEEEIAQQYGMAEKQVRQALALGRLSPQIREAWRKGAIKAEVAKAFTLGLDHAIQDKVFDKLAGEHGLNEGRVRLALGVGDGDVAQLLDVVGVDAYRARGGTVAEDLFGSAHVIDDEALLKQMARALLEARCAALKTDGWGWAEIKSDLPRGAQFWAQSQPKQLAYEGDEEERLAIARARIGQIEEDDGFIATILVDEHDRLGAEIDAIEQVARSRSFDEKKRKKLGCIVDIADGRLIILYGVKKPEEARLPSADAEPARNDAGASKTSTPARAVEEPEISQALLQRLSVQLTRAAATALIQDVPLALSVLLAGFGCYDDCGVRVTVNGLGSRDGRGVLGADEMDKALPLAAKLKHDERLALLAVVAANALDFQYSSLDKGARHLKGPIAICNAIDPKALNAALRGAFDAADYFGSVNKTLCLKAIEEAMGKELAQRQAEKPKGDIAAFAIENVPKTGWLPPQLRADGYDGPPVARKTLAKAEPAKKAKGKAAPAPKAKKAVKKKSAKKR